MKRLRKLRLTLAVLALMLGAAHIVFGVLVFKSLTLESFWFLSFGLAMIVTALSNLKSESDWMLSAQNTLTLGFICTLAFLAPQIQIFLGCVLFAGLLFISFERNTV